MLLVFRERSSTEKKAVLQEFEILFRVCSKELRRVTNALSLYVVQGCRSPDPILSQLDPFNKHKHCFCQTYLPIYTYALYVVLCLYFSTKIL
jgi:hypothetical protein